MKLVIHLGKYYIKQLNYSLLFYDQNRTSYDMWVYLYEQ